MHALLVLWDFSSGSNRSFAELREYLKAESIPRFKDVDGLRQKTWISNPGTHRWGALYIFEERAQAEEMAAHVAGGRVAEMTGKAPEVVELFDVEAVVEGRHGGASLDSVGLAREVRG